MPKRGKVEVAAALLLFVWSAAPCLLLNHLLSLSTQFSDIVEFIRGGDAKKGESGSSSRPPPVRVERRPLPTPQSPRDVAGGSSAVRIPTFPRTTGTFAERVEQARRHILESGLVISVEEAAERIRQADFQVVTICRFKKRSAVTTSPETRRSGGRRRRRHHKKNSRRQARNQQHASAGHRRTIAPACVDHGALQWGGTAQVCATRRARRRPALDQGGARRRASSASVAQRFCAHRLLRSQPVDHSPSIVARLRRATTREERRNHPASKRAAALDQPHSSARDGAHVCRAASACDMRIQARGRDASHEEPPHAAADCGSLRQSGPRPDPRLLRQAALEALTRSARTDSPRRTGRKQISGDDRRREGSGGGGVFERGRRRWCLGLGFAMGEL
ncbi:hypothetical protein F511_05633 [Dorcoceras hygrometricum]|uniref:Uncharacterized protein n=1 Tax=Dorcoceras hygrometricum TaxID=472368 RepID=A0A2Z7CW25_9LAMI|nr:hypothetical protein F511_05633 [Dorcoceras hygrometricum]